jgi:hypothetical protein
MYCSPKGGVCRRIERISASETARIVYKFLSVKKYQPRVSEHNPADPPYDHMVIAMSSARRDYVVLIQAYSYNIYHLHHALQTNERKHPAKYVPFSEAFTTDGIRRPLAWAL